MSTQRSLNEINGGHTRSHTSGISEELVFIALITAFHAVFYFQVSIACPERMEPITKVSHIPPSRWALVCSLCKLKTGACIQVRTCLPVTLESARWGL